jgi:hypothetical protein
MKEPGLQRAKGRADCAQDATDRARDARQTPENSSNYGFGGSDFNDTSLGNL